MKYQELEYRRGNCPHLPTSALVSTAVFILVRLCELSSLPKEYLAVFMNLAPQRILDPAAPRNDRWREENGRPGFMAIYVETKS